MATHNPTEDATWYLIGGFGQNGSVDGLYCCHPWGTKTITYVGNGGSQYYNCIDEACQGYVVIGNYAYDLGGYTCGLFTIWGGPIYGIHDQLGSEHRYIHKSIQLTPTSLQRLVGDDVIVCGVLDKDN